MTPLRLAISGRSRRWDGGASARSRAQCV